MPRQSRTSSWRCCSAGFLGVLGQGVRAIVGLKNAGSLNSTTPGEQAVFSLAYLALSLMIGFIAGVLAGIALNLETIITVDPSNWKLLVGIAGSGYIGADFIENAMSVVIPGTKPTQAKAPPPAVATTPTPAAAPLPPRVLRKAPPAAPQTDEGAKALTAAMRSVCPEVNAAVWSPGLVSAFDHFDFSNDWRKAAALGQFLVEGGASAMNAIVEDLYYSPDRACEVWPALFPSSQAAAPYCGDTTLRRLRLRRRQWQRRRGERRWLPFPRARSHSAYRPRRIRSVRPGDR